MRTGRTSTICFLSIGAAYAANFVGCGGSDTNDGKVGGTGTTPTSSTTIVITGGAGGGGSGGGPGTGGSGGNGGTVIINGDAACVAEPRAGEQIPIDLFFMVDKSGSMTCPVPAAAGPACTAGNPNNPPPVNRWTSIKDALVTFANSSSASGIGMGIGFFPKMNGNMLLCNPTDYSTPAAGIALLPGAAGALQAALNAERPTGSTPTVPALSGAVAYATTYAQAHQGRTTAIVFATDGVPTECAGNNNDIMGAAAVASAAANPPAGVPPIRTFVLGVGPSLGNLNQIAAAGGTNAAHLVEGGGSAELLAALNEIRKGTLTCDYQIPVIPGRPLNLDLVNINVRVGPPPAMSQLISKVDKVENCGATQGGWYFDPPPPATPTKIVLCPATCGPMLKTTGSTLDVLIGCGSIVIPPK